MQRRTIWLTGLLLTFLLLLAACGGANDAPAAEEPAAAEAQPTEAPAEEAEGDTAAEADNNDTAEASSDETSSDAAAQGMTTFVVDSAQSSASYIVDEEFLADALSKLGIPAGQTVVEGTTGQVQGQLQVDPANATVSGGEFTVDLTGLATDQNRRDNWIQENGPRFMDFPTASFVITGVDGAPESYTPGEEVSFQLTGDMTIRETTKPVTFDVTAALEGDTLTGVATADSLLTEWGIEPPSFVRTLTVADPFTIRVEITATAQ